MMKKRIFAGLLALMMALFAFASCGDAAMDGEMSSVSTDGGYKGGYTYDSEESVSNGKVEGDTATAPDDPAVLERKIIKTYRIRLEAKAYEDAVTLITSAVGEFGGYIANASQEGSGVSSARARSASYTVRIPAERADAYIERISSECNVLSSSLTTDDVTDTYYGYEAKMESLLMQEERLLSMISKAEKLNDLIVLEDKLSSVRAEISGLNKQLQLMDKSVMYSYIYITLNEVVEYQEPEEETYFDRLLASVGGTFVSFARVLGEILIVVIWLLPYIVIAVGVLVGIHFVRKKKKNQKKDKGE
ncbi:MAG: DUF4349 domain-containing protein [Clostridia bacterium]|nr:DUF4349 domain-containing protein [Clostridia bacterium]